MIEQINRELFTLQVYIGFLKTLSTELPFLVSENDLTQLFNYQRKLEQLKPRINMPEESQLKFQEGLNLWHECIEFRRSIQEQLQTLLNKINSVVQQETVKDKITKLLEKIGLLSNQLQTVDINKEHKTPESQQITAEVSESFEKFILKIRNLKLRIRVMDKRGFWEKPKNKELVKKAYDLLYKINLYRDQHFSSHKEEQLSKAKAEVLFYDYLVTLEEFLPHLEKHLPLAEKAYLAKQKRLSSYHPSLLRLQRNISAHQQWLDFLQSESAVLKSSGLTRERLLSVEKSKFFESAFKKQTIGSIVSTLNNFLAEHRRRPIAEQYQQLNSKKTTLLKQIDLQQKKLQSQRSAIKSLAFTASLAITQKQNYVIASNMLKYFADKLAKNTSLELSPDEKELYGEICGITVVCAELAVDYYLNPRLLLGSFYNLILAINDILLSHPDFLFAVGNRIDTQLQTSKLYSIGRFFKSRAPAVLKERLPNWGEYLRFDELGQQKSGSWVRWLSGLASCSLLCWESPLLSVVVAYSVATSMAAAASKLTNQCGKWCGVDEQSHTFLAQFVRSYMYGFSFMKVIEQDETLYQPPSSPQARL